MASEGADRERASSDSADSWDMKKHASSAFKQQRLPAWSPILSPSTVLPFFLLTGAVLIPVGVALLFLSESVREYQINYTYCPQYFQENGSFGQRSCAEIIEETNETCHCAYNFTVLRILSNPVFIYYQLSNYHQNHRRYVNSRDDTQLLGNLNPEVSSYCAPFDYDEDGRAIAPCGAVADSLFNDSMRLRLVELPPPPTRPPPSELPPTLPPHHDDGDYNQHDSRQAGPQPPMDVPLLRTGIAWPSDKARRFGNPPGDLSEAFADYAKPHSWRRHVYELDPDNDDNNGFLNEDLIVWMRTAGLPTFRKLYRRVDHSGRPFEHGLPAGHYTVYIDYNYPVTPFEGTKTFIATATTAIGAGNQFLGAAYVTSGCLCLLLGAVFVALHLRYRQATALMVTVEPETPYL